MPSPRSSNAKNSMSKCGTAETKKFQIMVLLLFLFFLFYAIPLQIPSAPNTLREVVERVFRHPFNPLHNHLQKGLEHKGVFFELTIATKKQQETPMPPTRPSNKSQEKPPTFPEILVV